MLKNIHQNDGVESFFRGKPIGRENSHMHSDAPFFGLDEAILLRLDPNDFAT